MGRNYIGIEKFTGKDSPYRHRMYYIFKDFLEDIFKPSKINKGTMGVAEINLEYYLDSFTYREYHNMLEYSRGMMNKIFRNYVDTFFGEGMLDFRFLKGELILCLEKGSLNKMNLDERLNQVYHYSQIFNTKDFYKAYWDEVKDIVIRQLPRIEDKLVSVIINKQLEELRYVTVLLNTKLVNTRSDVCKEKIRDIVNKNIVEQINQELKEYKHSLKPLEMTFSHEPVRNSDMSVLRIFLKGDGE